MRFVALSLLLTNVALPQRFEDELKNPFAGQPEAIEVGHTLYLQSCSGCHGPNAEGGRGPRLAQNNRIRGGRNRRLFDSIKNGVRGSDMPPSPLPDDRIWQMITYLKAINSPAYDLGVKGNTEAGEKIFHGSGGCLQCHSLRGKGAAIGPDLTNIGARSLESIRESLLQPSARPTEGFLPVTVQLKAGPILEGVAKDNTNYAIAVMDRGGKLHLLSKSDVSEVTLHKNSLMPEDYGKRLSKAEVEDLLAFLSRQVARVPEKEGR